MKMLRLSPTIRVVGWAAVLAIAIGGLLVAARFRDRISDPFETGADSAVANQKDRTHERSFVGSRVCAECHAEIAERYQKTHSMARAAQIFPEHEAIEDYSQGEFQPGGDRRIYWAQRDGERIVHHEILRDRSGQPLYDQLEPIYGAIGSGQRGRSYFVHREGFLFQSPISWYTQKNAFALSPGYDVKSHLRFDRVIDHQCAFCHFGHVQLSDEGDNRFGALPVLEAAIGCERCHGPGEEHVARRRAGLKDLPNQTIVNPSRLDNERRESVCYQCHLRSVSVFPRSEMRAEDFRPGMRYDEVWVAFVPALDSGQRADTVVHQLRSSACFRGSQGALGCIACHDPHSRPNREERASFYERRCLRCHQADDCTRPEEPHAASTAEQSCIECHMPRLPTEEIPHTALTDHSIQRKAADRPAPPAQSDGSRLELFVQDSQAMPQREIDRAWGMLLASQAASRGDRAVAQAAIERFSRAAMATDNLHAENDAAALQSLGLAWVVNGRYADAEAAWRRAAEIDQHDAMPWRQLSKLLIASGQIEAAEPCVRRCIEANPWLAEHHWTLALVLSHLGKSKEAVASAERASALDPSATAVRAWLAEAYGKIGELDKQAEQFAWLRRAMQTAAPQKIERSR